LSHRVGGVNWALSSSGEARQLQKQQQQQHPE